MLLRSVALALLAVGATGAAPGKEEKVVTAVYGRVGNGYKREKAKDGSFKPEYYALSNGGRVAGTTSDTTIERVTYQEVADIAMKLLATRNYHYAKSAEQAKLLLVLNWGRTLAPNGANVGGAGVAVQNFKAAQQDLDTKLAAMQKEEGLVPSYAGENRVANASNGLGKSIQFATNEDVAVAHAAGAVENQFAQSQANDRVRDQLNEKNARVLGYLDELADSNDIRRYAGGGDRYSDMIAEVEESRYYIVISAYDFRELTGKNKKKLLWQTRVSVRSPGNSFDDSIAAMLKSASRYFGQNSGKLIRGEETKGTVELGELKYLGEAKERKTEPAK
jgi:hypothetical protein